MEFRRRDGMIGCLLLAGALAAPAPGWGGQPPAELPEGYIQVLPRGRIPAVVEPVFVPAREAKIRDDAWVLGVVIDGEAHAYSLNLLNRHEVVNDTFGKRHVAAVW
ncbi:MAG: DUF3179 domain-containing protein [Deltaproteobacteria bacterium]|nr:MAG: DUF3179 domain-containing protein [Deltaproteobacteria bacterium]